MAAGVGDPKVEHETQLTTWHGYVTYVEQLFNVLPPDKIILEIGAGFRDVVDPTRFQFVRLS